MQITFVTGNQNKVREAEKILGVKLESVDIKTPEIQTLDPELCVREKAKSAYEVLKKPVMVEDVSLFFEAWNGLPGVFVDYFMKTIDNQGLLRLLSVESNRKAQARVSICVYDGKEAIVAMGITDGEIAMEIRGENGFGWDKIFIPKGTDKTQAELREDEKNVMSARKMAYDELRTRIANFIEK